VLLSLNDVDAHVLLGLNDVDAHVLLGLNDVDAHVLSVDKESFSDVSMSNAGVSAMWACPMPKWSLISRI
jgi:hypothetical protein